MVSSKDGDGNGALLVEASIDANGQEQEKVEG